MRIWPGSFACAISAPHRRCDVNLSNHEMTSGKQEQQMCKTSNPGGFNYQYKKKKNHKHIQRLITLVFSWWSQITLVSAQFTSLSMLMCCFSWPIFSMCNGKYLERWKLELLTVSEQITYMCKQFSVAITFWEKCNATQTTFTVSICHLFFLKE